MSSSPKLTAVGRITLLLFVAGCLYGAWRLYLRNRPGASAAAPAGSSSPSTPDAARVRVGIAYGTEKERWLIWAKGEYAKTEVGRATEIDLIPMGSLEGAQAILGGDPRIQVWSPASALYKEVFVDEWRLKNGGSPNGPIVREESLALTPMVFVMWAERHAAFSAKYGAVSFRTVAQALAEPSGWQGIAGKPQWGYFKLGHTHPNQSNSGLMTLVLMAYDYHQKAKGLTLQDILDPGYTAWADGVERAVSGLSNSTGTMMREMVLKGPSAYDALFVYESVALDYLKNAEGRWGELHISYPARNLWSENPYYILDVPGSSAEQRKAAGDFLDFLLSERIQRQALVHGFRPANPAVPVRTPDSPFVAYQRFGVSPDLGITCETPKAEVIHNLLAGWERNHGG